MNNISIFEFESQSIRFVDGKPVANDVATVLGYADPAKAVSTKVKDKNKSVTKMLQRNYRKIQKFHKLNGLLRGRWGYETLTKLGYLDSRSCGSKVLL
ncbi:MAG: BRO family protein [Dolichospermum sp.]